MLRLSFPASHKPATADLSHTPSMENESPFSWEVHACSHTQHIVPQRVAAVL